MALWPVDMPDWKAVQALLTRGVEALEDLGPAPNPPKPTAIDAARAIDAVFDEYVNQGGPIQLIPDDVADAERSGYLSGLNAAARIARNCT